MSKLGTSGLAADALAHAMGLALHRSPVELAVPAAPAVVIPPAHPGSIRRVLGLETAIP